MDNHEILGISRDASPEEIKHAYRQLCKKYHPDVNDAPNAAAFFPLIHTAYQEMLNVTDNKSTTEQQDPPSPPEQPPRDKTTSPPPQGRQTVAVFVYPLFGILKIIQFLMIPVAFVAVLFLSLISAIFHMFSRYLLGWVPVIFFICWWMSSFDLVKVVFVLLLLLFGLSAIFWALANGVVLFKDWLDLKIEELIMRWWY